MSDRATWSAVLAARSVWLRAATISAPVALLQVAINQGDHWLRGTVTAVVVAKTIATPLVTLSVALASAASTERSLRRRETPSETRPQSR